MFICSKGLSNPPYLIETEEQKYVLCKEPSDVIPRGSESKLQQVTLQLVNL